MRKTKYLTPSVILPDGRAYRTAAGAIRHITNRREWENLVASAEPETLAKVYTEKHPQTPVEFLRAYLEAADSDLILK